MNSEEFVKEIHRSIIDDNLSSYCNLLNSTEPESATDPYWQRAIALYATLNADDRRVLFDIIRQIMVDTISSVFGLLDGVSRLAGQEGDFSLFAHSSPERLNGELQDRFLELEEDRSRPRS